MNIFQKYKNLSPEKKRVLLRVSGIIGGGTYLGSLPGVYQYMNAETKEEKRKAKRNTLIGAGLGFGISGGYIGHSYLKAKKKYAPVKAETVKKTISGLLTEKAGIPKKATSLPAITAGAMASLPLLFGGRMAMMVPEDKSLSKEEKKTKYKRLLVGSLASVPAAAGLGYLVGRGHLTGGEDIKFPRTKGFLGMAAGMTASGLRDALRKKLIKNNKNLSESAKKKKIKDLSYTNSKNMYRHVGYGAAGATLGMFGQEAYRGGKEFFKR